ncbi:MAG: FAD-binding oxidoreductase [Pseudorhodoplanes sp.]
MLNPDKDLITRFSAIVGAKYALTDPDLQAAYLHEMRDRWVGTTPLVLRPETTEQVSQILKLANETRTAIVPQGGNTGLVGGQIPFDNEIVLSLNRMTKIRELDPVTNTITVEAGATLQRVREAAAEANRLYPQLLPSEGSCTIGGNLSTNAGGTAALAQGNARAHALGLEVVLADGRVLHNLNKLKKDNTGYDLKNLFIGAEGTLGIITAAVLRLVPRPRAVEVAFFGLPSSQAAVDLLGIAQARAGADITSFELLTRFGLETVLKHVEGARDPLEGQHPWYVLMEISSQASAGVRDLVEEIFEAGVESGLIEDGAIAQTLEQGKAFWRIREEVGEVQKKLGGSIKHDVSVPIASIPSFIEEANAAVLAAMSGARPFPFGHVGDGNIHYNISQPEGTDKSAFMAQEDVVQDAVFRIVLKHGGSISAEHGIGIAKRERLPQVKDPVAIELMRALKATLDPNGILNPGKVL